MNAPCLNEGKKQPQHPHCQSPIVSNTMGRVAGEEALRHSRQFDAQSRLAKHFSSREKRNITELRWSDLEIGRLLGEGNFSHVYEVKLIYRDDLPDTGTVATGNETIQVDVWNSNSVDWRNPRVAVKEEQDIWDLVSVADDMGSDSGYSDEEKVMGPREMKLRERVYALKHLHPQVTKRQKKFTASAIDLVLEAKLLSCLDHPNIVRLFGVTEGSINKLFSEHGYFLLLDRLHETLEDKIEEWAATEAMIMARMASPLPSQGKSSSKMRRSASTANVVDTGLYDREREKILGERIGSVMIDIARGMEYLHRQRIIFRDLKVSLSHALFSEFVFAQL